VKTQTIICGALAFAFLSSCILSPEASHFASQTHGRPVEVSYNSENSSLTFFALGDYGEGNAHQKAVAALIEKLCSVYNPEAMLALGDNIYPDGVKSEIDPQWKTKFEGIYSAPCTASKRWIAIPGNHDYRGNPDAQVAYSKKNSRWLMPARSFVVHYGLLLDIFASDSNTGSKCASPDCGFSALQNIASSSVAKWKIILAHHPLVSAGEHKTPPKGLPEKLIPLYCVGKIDFLFAGHDHNLQHNVGKMLNSPCTINEIVSGAGGAQLYNVSPIEGVTRFAQKDFGFSVVQLENKKATVSMFTVSSGERPVYTFTVEK
jgi:acid phosphatase